MLEVQKATYSRGPIRVCHVCSAHEADDGRVFDRSCRTLADAGYDVHLIASTPEKTPMMRAGVTVHAAPSFRNRAERLWKRGAVAQLAASLDADIYHVHEPELLGPVVRIADGRPVIWDVHEPYSENIQEKHWIPPMLRPLTRRLWERQESRLMAKCAAVVPVTDELAARYHAAHRRVCVIRNFPRLSSSGGSCVVRERRCVFTGTISPNRALEVIVEAIAILRDSGLSIPLDLAGPFMSDVYKSRVLGRAAARGVTDLVRYHGIVPRSEALALQARSSVGLVVESESPGATMGIPVKMLEYMEGGLPIIYSSLPIIEKTLAGEDCGIAVRPDDAPGIARAIALLTGDGLLARRLGANGARAVRQSLNWQAESLKLIELYSRIVESTASLAGRETYAY